MKGIFKPSLIAIAIGLGVSGCNVSVDLNDEDEEVKVGYFVDSGVEGVYYQTESESGFTGYDGMFYYQEGDSITFSIGDVSLPTTMAKAEITPVDLVGADPTDSTVINILQFLQSLDDDADPSNGIYITSAINASFTGESLDFYSDTFDSDFEALITPLNLTLVSEQDALAHFLNLPTYHTGSMLHGSWIFTEKDDAGQAEGRHVLTFLDDNKYILVHETADDEGGDQIAGSVEYGKYSIDDLTGEFKVEQVISASDGDGGLENEGRPNEQYFSYNANGQLELTIREAPELADGNWDTNQDNWGDFNTLYLDNAFNPADPMTGSWVLSEIDDNGDPIMDSINVITLFGNGEYVVAHTMNTEAYGTDTPLSASSEWGSFTHDDNGGFTINTPSIDLDGNGGLYDAEETNQEVTNIMVKMNGDLSVTEIDDLNVESSFSIMPLLYPKMIMESDVDHFESMVNGNKESFMFNDDKSGTYSHEDDSGNVSSDNFSWSIKDGRLELTYSDNAVDYFTLVGGTLSYGYLSMSWDDDGDGQLDGEGVLIKTISMMDDYIPLTSSDIVSVNLTYTEADGTPLVIPYTFNSDGTGSVTWEQFQDFDWSVNDAGELELTWVKDDNTWTSVTRLLEGTFTDGKLVEIIDDNNDGTISDDEHFQYESSLPTSTGSTIIPLMAGDITGTVLFSYFDAAGNPDGTGEFTFVNDGSGSVKWDDDANDIENFTWSITQSGELEIDLANAPTSDIYSLIQGTFSSGELIGEIDQDEANGDREASLQVMTSSSVSNPT